MVKGVGQQASNFPRQRKRVSEVILELDPERGELGSKGGSETWVSSGEMRGLSTPWKWKCKREESCSEAGNTVAG